MGTIFMSTPLFLVKDGPCPGVYPSQEHYEKHLRKVLAQQNSPPTILQDNPWLDEGQGG